MPAFLKRLAEYAAKADQRTYGPTTPDAPVFNTGNGVGVRGLSNEELKEFNESVLGEEPEFGINFGRIGELLDPDSELNLGETLAKLKEQNAALFNHMRRGSMTMEQMVAMATNAGANKIVVQFLRRQPGDVLSSEDVVGGLLLLNRLQFEIQSGAKAAMEVTEEGQFINPPDVRSEIHDRIKVLAAIRERVAVQVSGNVSEMARGLAAVSHVKKLNEIDTAAFNAQVTKISEDLSQSQVDFNLQNFALLSPTGQVEYARKSMLAKTWDVLIESHINAILSSPITHSINMAGNWVMQGVTLAETAVAGAIGETRSLVTGKQLTDRVFMGEAHHEMLGMARAQMDAMLLAGKAFVTGESGDFTSKIDLREYRAVGSTDNLIDIGKKARAARTQGELFDVAQDMFGTFLRVPGRFMIAEDEYFKVMSMRRELYRQAFVAEERAFITARKAGISREEAREIARNAHLEVLADPGMVENQMKARAKELTFQNDVKGIFGTDVAPGFASQMQAGSTHPAIKPILPFYRTPQNVINAISDRTVNIYPWLKAIQDGRGRDFDEAMAKFALGNGVFWMAVNQLSGMTGDDVIVTGTGPSDYGAQQLMKFQPSTISIKQEDGSYDSVSFARLDPLSGVLHMAADYVYLSKNSPDEAGLTDAAINGILATANYAGDLPFLQSFAEFSRVSAPGLDPQERMGLLAQTLSKKYGDVAMSFGGQLEPLIATPLRAVGVDVPMLGTTSFQAAIERIKFPEKKITAMPAGNEPVTQFLEDIGFVENATPYSDLNPIMQGFYESYFSAMARNSAFSEELPTQVNFFGEPIRQSEERVDEYFNPIKIQNEIAYTALDEELTYLTDVGYSFRPHEKRYEGIPYNRDQIARYHYMVSNIDAAGRLPEDANYDVSTSLINSMDAELYNPSYTQLESASERYDRLNQIVGERRRDARVRFFDEDPDFSVVFEKYIRDNK